MTISHISHNWRWCTFSRGCYVLFSINFGPFLPLCALIGVCFAGLNNVAVCQNWQIWGMVIGHDSMTIYDTQENSLKWIDKIWVHSSFLRYSWQLRCALKIEAFFSLHYFYQHCDGEKNNHILPTGQWYAPSAVINDALIMPEYARACQSMPDYARVCQSMPEYARVCQSMPEYARVCQSMP